MEDNIINEPAPKYNYISPEDYLNAERTAKEKHEYYEGKVVAMAGASLNHNEIVSNVIGNCRNTLEGKNCRIYPSDLKIQILSKGSYTYPDATIICGDPGFTDDHFDTIKNPLVIFEVTSPSSEDYDKEKKFFYYIQIPSLKEYILISTKFIVVTIARRQADNSWKFEKYNSIDDILSMQSVGIQISLSKIYEKVIF